MTQYLPPDDDFEEGAGAITTHPATWVRYEPWASLTPIASWPWTLSFENLEFFDRYFGATKETSGGGYISTQAIPVGHDRSIARPCVVAYPSAVGVVSPATLHGAAMFRGAVGVNVDIKAGFYTLVSEPTGSNLYGVGSCGIGARLQSGTNYSGSAPDDERVAGGDGYWFVLGMDSMDHTDPSFDFHLIRVVSGVATVLATEVYDASSGHYAKLALSEGAPFRLRMTVSTNGATVEIRCYHTPYYNYDTFQYGVERTSISYDDTHASRITGTGRFGLFNSSEYYQGSQFEFAIPCCGYVQVNLLGSTILFRDEWVRNYKDEANRIDSHVGHNQFSENEYGYSLQSAYINDNFGFHRQSYIYDTVLPSTALDGLEFDFDVINAKDSTACGQTCIAARPADDPVKQDRSIDFYFSSTGNATNKTLDTDRLYKPTENSTRSAGIVLRESGYDHTKPSYPEPLIGYACSFQRDDNTAFTELSLYRFNPNGTRTIIAEMSGGPTLTLDTWYTARMKIDGVAGPHISDAVEIKVYLDTVQQTFVGPAAGITIDSSGTVYDEGDNRILTGYGEGFRVNTADNSVSGSPRKTYLDNWEQGADSGPDDPDESDQDSITVGREDDDSSGTLTLNAGWSVNVSSTYGRREHLFEYPEYRYANATMLKPRRVWTIGASAITEAETDALLVFWNEHHGTQRAFSWTTDESESVTVHFMDDDLVTALLAPEVTTFRIRLEEVFDGS